MGAYPKTKGEITMPEWRKGKETEKRGQRGTKKKFNAKLKRQNYREDSPSKEAFKTEPSKEAYKTKLFWNQGRRLGRRRSGVDS